MAEPLPRRILGVTGYVLAGGQSRRMGEDKAAVELGGRPMLEWAAEKLARVCAEVVIVGPERAGSRQLRDVHPGCGPIGGMEVALADVGAHDDWAAFLPVDMPLLPVGLVGALHTVWAEAGTRGAKVCMAVGDAVMQPLVSVVHRALLPWVQAAVKAGRFRVRPLLEDLGAELGGVERTEVSLRDDGTVEVGAATTWHASEAEWAMRRLWWSNLNTPEDLKEARSLVGHPGR